jgi:hypothetical protein
LTRIQSLALVGMAALMACTSARAKELDRAADQMNPLLLVLIPKVAAIEALGRTAAPDDPALFGLCSSADPELMHLSHLEPIKTRKEAPAAVLAGYLLDRRQPICAEPAAPGGISLRCTWWCLQEWGGFTEELRRLREAGAEEGVAFWPVPIVHARQGFWPEPSTQQGSSTAPPIR